MGFAMPLPAMSGALPCTGSNTDGKARSGLMLPLGARPMLPVMIAPMSVSTSPNRLLATTTSNDCGRRMKFMQAASTSSDSVSMSGYSAATWSKTSSQSTMP